MVIRSERQIEVDGYMIKIIFFDYPGETGFHWEIWNDNYQVEASNDISGSYQCEQECEQGALTYLRNYRDFMGFE
ncbi:MAG: hypothetical protein F6K31_02530 [Symploca sp. SIO2G7]|nr:hypothetical protein [Symploca sp. SIO2G7]NER45740.1 hypothetical protein [Symploca sp. SIO1A3]